MVSWDRDLYIATENAIDQPMKPDRTGVWPYCTNEYISMNGLSSAYADKSPSLAPKATLVIIHICVLCVALWLLAGGGIASIDHLCGIIPGRVVPVRREVLEAAAVLYFLRTLVTVFIFMHRRMAWTEAIGVACWIALFDMLFWRTLAEGTRKRLERGTSLEQHCF